MADSLAEACTVQRVTRSSDGMGGMTQSWATIATTVCSSSRYSDDVEAAVAERLQGRPGYRLRLPYDVVPTLGDRVVTDARTFDVVAVTRRPSGISTELIVVEV